MPIFIDPRGLASYGLGICARCSRKMSILKLSPDPNSPGLMVCDEDKDVLDPWRLPARQTEDITLPFYRPDLPLTDSQVIAPPTNLAGAVNGNCITITWTASVTLGVNCYDIFRQTAGTGPFVLLAQACNVLSYTDCSVTSGITYTYSVTSVMDLDGSENQSSFPSGTTSVTAGGFLEPASALGIIQGQGGFLIGGFLDINGNPLDNSVRFSSTLLSLALPPNISIGGFVNPVGPLFHVTGRFVVTDGVSIADSSNGTAWTLAINPGAGTIFGGYSLTYDSLAGKVIFGSNDNPSAVYISSNTSPLNFTAVLIPGASNAIGPVAYKGGSTGITLAMEAGSGLPTPHIWKSTDGGATWTAVSPAIFDGSNEGFIGFGQTNWLAIGGAFSTGEIRASVSTNDGTTWSAPVTLPGANADGTFESVSVATDGAGNWVVISTALPPNNYWVSNDDGSTWSSPNILSAQGGAIPGSLVFSGGQWIALWLDPTQTFSFLATSPDGQTWTQIATIQDLI